MCTDHYTRPADLWIDNPTKSIDSEYFGDKYLREEIDILERNTLVEYIC